MFEVDPETYRYFFSASAQVFAAIFAVVAIAYGYRIIDLQRKYDELQKEKVGKVFTYKNLIYNLNKFINGHCRRQEFLDNIFNLDNTSIEAMLKAIVDRCEFLLQGDDRLHSAQNITKKALEKIKESVEDTLNKSKKVDESLIKARGSVLTPVIFAALMTIGSLFMLSIQNPILKTCLTSWVIFVALIVFALSLGYITYKFIELFSNY